MSDPTDYYAQLSREINEGDPDPAERRRRKEARFIQLYGLAPGKTFADIIAQAGPAEPVRRWRPATDDEVRERQYVLVVAEHRETYELKAERLYATTPEEAAAAAGSWLADYPAEQWRRDKPSFQGSVVTPT